MFLLFLSECDTQFSKESRPRLENEYKQKRHPTGCLFNINYFLLESRTRDRSKLN
jgi:hypothetical protein